MNEPDDVAVAVFQRCDQLAATDVSDRELHLGASRKESFETLVDVVDVPVADRPVMPWL